MLAIQCWIPHLPLKLDTLNHYYRLVAPDNILCSWIIFLKICLYMYYPFMPSGFFYFNSLDSFISYIRSVWLVFITVMFFFLEISELNANSVDPDQTPSSAASDLGLHCLPVSLLWDARLIWVKSKISSCWIVSL